VLPWELAPGLDGSRTVFVQSRDEGGAESATLSASTVLDRRPPEIQGVGLREIVPGAWVVTFVASDLTGVDRVAVRWRTGTADWSPWRLLDSLSAGSTSAPTGTRVTVEIRVSDPLGHRSVRRATSSTGSPRQDPDDRSCRYAAAC
jgi:hypothetical protein